VLLTELLQTTGLIPVTLRTSMSQTATLPASPVTKRSGGTATMAGARTGRYDRFAWITCTFMSLFHIGAIWALLDFTWSGLAVFIATYYVSLAWGIGM